MSNHYEDTIWKQITTENSDFYNETGLWAIITKIQSESKSQHTKWVMLAKFGCEQSLRRYNLKANHNISRVRLFRMLVVSNHYEDTIWKQITTSCWYVPTGTMLWAIITKIQSESKSQPISWWYASTAVVSNHYEDTIWKQITTCCNSHLESFLLWAIITKIQSESKSQLIAQSLSSSCSCEQSLRRYNLKANHNNCRQ